MSVEVPIPVLREKIIQTSAVLQLLSQRDDEVTKLKKKIKSLMAKFQERNATIVELKKQVNEYKDVSDKASEDKEKVIKDFDELKKEHSQLQTIYNTNSYKYQQVCKELEEKKTENKVIVTNSKKKKSVAIQTINVSEKSVPVPKKIVEPVINDDHEFEDSNAILLYKIEGLEIQMNNKTKEIDKLQNQYKNEIAMLKRNHKLQVEGFSEETKNLRLKIKELNADKEKMMKLQQDYKKEIGKLKEGKAKLDKSVKEINELKEKIDSLILENSLLKSQAKSYNFNEDSQSSFMPDIYEHSIVSPLSADSNISTLKGKEDSNFANIFQFNEDGKEIRKSIELSPIRNTSKDANNIEININKEPEPVYSTALPSLFSEEFDSTINNKIKNKSPMKVLNDVQKSKESPVIKENKPKSIEKSSSSGSKDKNTSLPVLDDRLNGSYIKNGAEEKCNMERSNDKATNQKTIVNEESTDGNKMDKALSQIFAEMTYVLPSLVDPMSDVTDMSDFEDSNDTPKYSLKAQNNKKIVSPIKEMDENLSQEIQQNSTSPEILENENRLCSENKSLLSSSNDLDTNCFKSSKILKNKSITSIDEKMDKDLNCTSPQSFISTVEAMDISINSTASKVQMNTSENGKNVFSEKEANNASNQSKELSDLEESNINVQIEKANNEPARNDNVDRLNLSLSELNMNSLHQDNWSIAAIDANYNAININSNKPKNRKKNTKIKNKKNIFKKYKKGVEKKLKKIMKNEMKKNYKEIEEFIKKMQLKMIKIKKKQAAKKAAKKKNNINIEQVKSMCEKMLKEALNKYNIIKTVENKQTSGKLTDELSFESGYSEQEVKQVFKRLEENNKLLLERMVRKKRACSTTSEEPDIPKKHRRRRLSLRSSNFKKSLSNLNCDNSEKEQKHFYESKVNDDDSILSSNDLVVNSPASVESNEILEDDVILPISQCQSIDSGYVITDSDSLENSLLINVNIEKTNEILFDNLTTQFGFKRSAYKTRFGRRNRTLSDSRPIEKTNNKLRNAISDSEFSTTIFKEQKLNHKLEFSSFKNNSFTKNWNCSLTHEKADLSTDKMEESLENIVTINSQLNQEKVDENCQQNNSESSKERVEVETEELEECRLEDKVELMEFETSVEEPKEEIKAPLDVEQKLENEKTHTQIECVQESKEEVNETINDEEKIKNDKTVNKKTVDSSENNEDVNRRNLRSLPAILNEKPQYKISPLKQKQQSIIKSQKSLSFKLDKKLESNNSTLHTEKETEIENTSSSNDLNECLTQQIINNKLRSTNKSITTASDGENNENSNFKNNSKLTNDELEMEDDHQFKSSCENVHVQSTNCVIDKPPASPKTEKLVEEDVPIKNTRRSNRLKQSKLTEKSFEVENKTPDLIKINKNKVDEIKTTTVKPTHRELFGSSSDSSDSESIIDKNTINVTPKRIARKQVALNNSNKKEADSSDSESVIDKNTTNVTPKRIARKQVPLNSSNKKEAKPKRQTPPNKRTIVTRSSSLSKAKNNEDDKKQQLFTQVVKDSIKDKQKIIDCLKEALQEQEKKTQKVGGFKRPNALLKKQQSIDVPKSPERIDEDEVPEFLLKEPVVIPLDRQADMNEATAIGLLNELLNYPEEETVLNKVSDKFLCEDIQHIAFLIIQKTLQTLHDKVDMLFTPPVPPTTDSQRVLIGFISHLENLGCVGLMDCILKQIELKILACKKPEFLDPLLRMYSALCMLKSDIYRIRKFCCDILYFKEDLAAFCVFIIMSCWCEVLPVKGQVSSQSPFVKVIIIAILTLKDEYVKDLRLLLTDYYQYSIEDVNSIDVFNSLVKEYTSNPTVELLQSIVLLCKTQPKQWVFTRLNSTIKPLMEKPEDNNVLEDLHMLMEKIIKQFNGKKDKKMLNALTEWF